MAIVHRLFRDDGYWETSRFTINDVFMRQILTDLFEDYQGLDLHLEGWTFEKPYQPLVHRCSGQLNNQIADIRDDADVPLERKQAVDAPVSFLEPVLAPYVRALARTRGTGKISYEDIWQIFPPSELIVTTTRGVPHLGRVMKFKKKGEGWRIHSENLGWDGSRCGYVEAIAWIKCFSGDCCENSLKVYPVSFHKDPEGFRNAMLERGKKFGRLRGYQAQVYRGNMHLLDGKGIKQKSLVDGRVITDAFAYCMSSGNARPNMRSLRAHRGSAPQDLDNFIDRAGRDGFSSANMEADLNELSLLCLNGREIKNLVKTNQLLSQKAGGFGSMEKLYFLAEKRVHALKLLVERGT